MKIKQIYQGIFYITKPEIERQDVPTVFRQSIITIGTLILTVSMGFMCGYSGVLLPQIEAPNNTFVIEQNEAAWVASMGVLPVALGSILGIIMMDKFGRRLTLIISVFPQIFGWLLIIFTTNIEMMLSGRFFTGFGCGILTPVGPVYIAEISDPKLRGFFVSSVAFAVSLGVFLVQLLGTFLHWTTTAQISCCFPLIALIVLSLVPDSPSWYVKHSRIDEARKWFYWCRGYSEESKKELEALIERQSQKNDIPLQNKLKELMCKDFLKPLGIIAVYGICNQWVGVNVVTFYSVTIMKKIINGFDEYLAMLIIDATRLFMSIVGCVVIKHFGRRPLTFVSCIGTVLSLFTLSLYCYLVPPENEMSSLAAIPVITLVAYISFISIGFVPLPWTLASEMFPLKTRNIGSGTTASLAFINLFIVIQLTPFLFANLNTYGTFLLFGFIGLMATIFLYFFLPETKDKPLHILEDLYSKHRSQ